MCECALNISACLFHEAGDGELVFSDGLSLLLDCLLRFGGGDHFMVR